MRQQIFLGIAFLFGVGLLVGTIWLSSSNAVRVKETTSYLVPEMPSMTIPVARELVGELTPALLLIVYDAFSETHEEVIYDTLAQVTHGDALEFLYLERVGAMAGGGLDEANQKIHEISMLDTQLESGDSTLDIKATWQVIGTVGHAEHMHVRGNTYSANLSIAPIDGAWRIMDFELLEVNRDSAGDTFLAEEGDR